MKSTVTHNSHFLKLDFVSTQNKTHTDTQVDMRIEHIDVVYIEELVVDLKGFFDVAQPDATTQSEAWDKISEARE